MMKKVMARRIERDWLRETFLVSFLSPSLLGEEVGRMEERD